MSTREQGKSIVVVQSTPDPTHGRSFGNIGRFVEVAVDGDASSPGTPLVVSKALITLAYDEGDLGWVDEDTLRVFAVDKRSGRATLVEDSAVDAQARHVTALVGSQGTYGLFGLPADPGVLSTVRTMFEHRSQLVDEAIHGEQALLTRICGLILCVSDAGGLIAPGRFSGSVCDFCLGVGIAVDMPEFQLLAEVRTGKCRTTKPKPKPKPCKPTVTVTPNCGPSWPGGFAVFMDVSCFPPNTFCHFELLDGGGNRVFLGGGMTDASGNGYAPGGLEGWFGMYEPADTYTFRVFVDTDYDGVVDVGGAEASAQITVPCP